MSFISSTSTSLDSSRTESLADESEKIAVNQLLYDYVRLGAKEKVDALLENCYADINCVHYGENLLMTAIRTNNEDMAQFLIENGVNVNFRRNLVDCVKLKNKTCRLDCYQITCRQAAYDKGQQAIVHLIDFLNGNMFPFQREPPYFPQIRIFRAQTPNSLISLHEDFFEGYKNKNIDEETTCTQTNAHTKRHKMSSVNSAPPPHDHDIEKEKKETKRPLTNGSSRMGKHSPYFMDYRAFRQNKSFILRQHHNVQRCSSAPLKRNYPNASNIMPSPVFRTKFDKDPFPYVN